MQTIKCVGMFWPPCLISALDPPPGTSQGLPGCCVAGLRGHDLGGPLMRSRRGSTGRLLRLFTLGYWNQVADERLL